MDVYKKLAKLLDTLPNGYPETEDGAEIRLLEYIFQPEEAEMFLELRLPLETARQVADRTGRDYKETRALLKQMSKRGLVQTGKVDGGFGYGLLPFAVGIYEFQYGRLDEEMSKRFEDYYHKGLPKALVHEPQPLRVVPINENISTDMEIRPYESMTGLMDMMKSFAVFDCICRKQKAFVGDPCEHPLDVCMIMSETPNAYDLSPTVNSITKEEAFGVLKRSAEAGLVHQVTNAQEGVWHVCNCCTCSCGVLRAMAELGISNVTAKSVFVNTVDADICNGCETCMEYCQFDALKMGDDMIMTVSTLKCTGCGVCVPFCDTEAMTLVRREEDAPEIPLNEHEWMKERAEARGVDLEQFM